MASLPLDILKLDMSFMRNIKDEKRVRVLATCINLAKSLEMGTVSEGVETEEQIEILRKLGCNCVQGYYYSKPLCEEDFKEYLIKHQTSKE